MVYYLLNMYKYEESKLSRIFLLLSKINDINGNYLMVVFIESQTMYNLLLFNSIQLISNIFCFWKSLVYRLFYALMSHHFIIIFFSFPPAILEKSFFLGIPKKKNRLELHSVGIDWYWSAGNILRFFWAVNEEEEGGCHY